MTNETPDPLILTLTLKPEEEAWFTALRDEHFPAERNYLKAHIALFHNLPASNPDIVADIKALAEEQPHMTLQVTSVVNIGNGVAYKIESGALSALHKKLQTKWNEFIIPQDRQKLWPHITVQNKVTPVAAKALLAELLTDFEPFEIQATGLSLWQYLGGPWRFMEQFDFSEEN